MKLQEFLDCENCRFFERRVWRMESREIGKMRFIDSCWHAKICERLWHRWESELAEVDA